MFLWGIAVFILLLVYLLATKDVVKASLIFLVNIFIYYIFIYKIPFNVLILSLKDLAFIKIFVLIIATVLITLNILIMEKSDKFDRNILSYLFARLDAKAIFIFVIASAILTNYILLNLLVLLIIYRLVKIEKSVGYLSVNLLMILSIVGKDYSQYLNTSNVNYDVFVNFSDFIYIVVFIISLALIYLYSTIRGAVVNNEPPNYKYIFYLIMTLIISLTLHSSHFNDFFFFIIILFTFAFIRFAEKGLEKNYELPKHSILFMAFQLFLFIFMIRGLHDFYIVSIIILLFMVIFNKTKSAKEYLKIFKEGNYLMFIALIIFILTLMVSRILSINVINNNDMILNGDFMSFYSHKIRLLNSYGLEYLFTLFYSGYIFVDSIDLSTLLASLNSNYSLFVIMNFSLLFNIVLQFIILKTLNINEQIKENLIIFYTIIISIGVIILYIV